MALFKLSQKRKLLAVICISFSFFIAEISIAFKTKSLALLADAFHYLNDLISFVVALVAIVISERDESPAAFSFGWKRARLLGAFFNGVFLLALGVSIFLQSVERFIYVQEVQNPVHILAIGCVGLGLNILSVALVHEHHDHDHGGEPGTLSGDDGLGQPKGILLADIDCHHGHKHHMKAESHKSHAHNHSHHDYGNLGVLLHLVGDALNNIGVIIAAIVIWQSNNKGRFYADPAVSLGIAIMIFISAFPLVRYSGLILLQCAPPWVDIDDVKHDLEKIPGIESIHELHIWSLDQKKVIATAHVVVENNDLSNFMEQAKTASKCLHAYGIHSSTLQPEISLKTGLSVPEVGDDGAADGEDGDMSITQTPIDGSTTVAPSEGSTVSTHIYKRDNSQCQIVCGTLCESFTCCSARGV